MIKGLYLQAQNENYLSEIEHLKKFDIKQEMYLENSQLLDVVEETTLLELNIQSDYMCKKACNREWKIRRLKSLDPSKSDVCWSLQLQS